MRIAVASLQQESNSLSPLISRESDFDIAYCNDMLEKLDVKDILDEATAEIIPTLYAHALPGGVLAKEDYLRMADIIVEGIPAGVDGVWLYLHGAMHVEEIGSGEAYLLRRIREKVGGLVPIAAALDFHANNTDEFIRLCNIVCGFRTAPHRDQTDTQRKAMRLLLRCIKKGILPRPQMARADVIVPGDCVQTDLPPLSRIMEEADRMERIPGMLCVQVFNGQPWVDTPYTGPSMVVTHESDDELALDCARRLARMFYDARKEFRFQVEALEPVEAIFSAMRAAESPVFISDSGDNPTAGAAGDNAYLLNRLLESGARDTLVAGIMDEAACGACYEAEIGDTLTLCLGGSLDPKSERAEITGTLRRRGNILGYTGEDGGPAATLDCGGITVIVTARRAAFTNLDIFRSAGVDISRYRIIAVKLGYLFPSLAEAAARSILALTPGGSTEQLENMGHMKIHRPMYPLDDDFI